MIEFINKLLKTNASTQKFRQDTIFRLMDEIEQAQFTYEFIYRPKPGGVKQYVALGQKNSDFENE